jgi:hypothetical protein
MEGPTLDDARTVKSEIIKQFQDVKDFAGAGIGDSNGRPSVRVNWRVLPTHLELPSSMSGVDITHHEVGNIVPQ